MIHKFSPLLFLGILFTSFGAWAQTPEKLSLLRNITLNCKDSTLKFQIVDKPQKDKIRDNIDYSWYYNNQVNHNTGGYFGKLLHGDYRVFDQQNHMITDGNFDYGAKAGIWKCWYANGNIKCMLPYRNGKLNGTVEWYNREGELYRTLSYKNDKEHGIEKWFYADTVIVNKYRHGNKIVKKERIRKTVVAVKEKQPKVKIKKTPVEPLFPEDNTKDTVTKKDNNWFKHIFKKKKQPQEVKN